MTSTHRALTFSLLALFVTLAPLRSARPEGVAAPIFNGRSFAGWEHSDSHWTIEDDAITGEIPAGEELRRNLFLFWEGELHDFELRLRFRISGGPSANSGVQFRSHMLPGGGAAGYQADLDDGATWLGRIYDEHGRGLIAERGTEVSIAADGTRSVLPFRSAGVYRELIHEGEWNTYRVRAVGPRIEVFINGEIACVLIDNEIGQLDFSGKLALQLHSGPGPARIQFKDILLARLGRTEPPPPAVAPPRENKGAPRRAGIAPTGADGSPLNVGFEKGTLEGWTATGKAWERQPIKGDTVSPRRPGQASEHAGEYWLGGYEHAGDAPTGTLESEPFAVTHPFASFLVGGGPHHETRVEVIDVESEKVIHSASGSESENLQPVVVDLENHLGRRIALRIVDEHSGGWGHINYDDFRFHEELDEALKLDGLPRRVRTNPLLSHLRKNPAVPEPASPAESTVANMYLPEGFAADLIVAEPDVRQPIAFTFDERGRLWVVEAFTYPQRRPEGEGEDRVTIFADADGDGRFETRRVFAEGLNLVSGLEVGFGGVWLGAAPYLLFIPDRNRDDAPDAEPTVLLDGWGYQDTHETMNSLTWGPDGWLYGNQGVFNGSRIGRPGASDGERVELNAGVWRYHPVRHEFEVFARGGSNQWGLAFDDRGELFMTHCRSYWGGGPTTHIVLRGHYWNQANARHAPFVSGDHPPGAPQFRNFLRASARYGHGEGGAGARGSGALYGGHSHVGTMIYLGDNWPETYRDHLFTHNLHGHQINHQVNERRGSGYETMHYGRDFAYVEDPLYVAVDLDYGPDGAVYVIDWYDRQHCHSPHMERWDRTNGRIYRIRYASTFEPRTVDLGKLSDLDLVRLQAHPNDWYGRTARRLLQERAISRAIGADARAALLEIAAGEEPREVLRGLWTLHSIGALAGDLAERLLRHPDEHVRAWTIRLITEGKPASAARFSRFLAMAASDPSAFVRLALASYLADAPAEQAWPLAGALASHGEDTDDPYLPRMIWYGIAPHVPGAVDRAFALAERTKIPVLRDFIWWYAARTPAGLDGVVSRLHPDSLETDEARRALNIILFALEGVGSTEQPSSWDRVARRYYAHDDEELRLAAERLGALFGDEAVLSRMRAVLVDESASPERRRQAFEILMRAADAESVPAFLAFLDDAAHRSDVIGLLRRFSSERIAPALIERLGGFPDRDRQRTLGTLTVKASFAVPLLEAVLVGRVEKGSLTSFHIRQLRNLGDDAVNALVTRVWGQARDTTDDARSRLAALAKTFGEAPLWAYDGGAGREVYQKVCSTCHALEEREEKPGPDLAGSGRNGVEYFLESILDPNAVVGEDYQITVVLKNDGTVVSGLVQNETDSALTIRTVDETVVVAKADVAAREKQATSLMPEGLFDTLSEREVIELLKYLTSAG